MSIIVTGASGYVGSISSLSSYPTTTPPESRRHNRAQLDAPHALDAVLDAHQDARTYVSTALVVSFTAATPPPRSSTHPSIVRNTLESIRDHAPGIKRVVLTSSSASVVGPDKAFGYAGKYAEDEWSPLTYDMGKTNGTMAENKDDVKFDVVAIMPGLIVGPARFDSEVTKDSQPSTAGMIGGLLKLGRDGRSPMAAGAVDVRDVAKVHGSL
ncbi:NADPH-dependent methylglyoxal reductase GRE2 [Candida viswanathii]|uniref:NADPH-dependent methylglyoxal reductase GRE2 n=1 Tax=Candida viswanathii TaxID=5486 RepID=A0A367YHD2_9ASCO|nr:NADPH-dependent methylglyoxal reductase GRE2 [Candida viswanathii]